MDVLPLNDKLIEIPYFILCGTTVCLACRVLIVNTI